MIFLEAPKNNTREKYIYALRSSENKYMLFTTDKDGDIVFSALYCMCGSRSGTPAEIGN